VRAVLRAKKACTALEIRNKKVMGIFKTTRVITIALNGHTGNTVFKDG
jgi:hypothetical protein